MDPARNRQIADLFKSALGLDPARRAALFSEKCADDAALQARVERLLALDDASGSFLSPPLQHDEPTRGAEIAGGPLLGKRVGRYRIVRRIAAGGMGEVYEAVQEQPRRWVALKLIRRGVAGHEAVRRFEYEAQLLGRLRHPGIAQIYEAGTHEDVDGALGQPDGVPYFAMEYIPRARPLTNYALENHLSTRQRLELFIEVCEAVHYGHQKGIIHRDLKPSNILVASECAYAQSLLSGQSDDSGAAHVKLAEVSPESDRGGVNHETCSADAVVKVIDFGVARATESDIAMTTIQTSAGKLVGTLQYMSPEQCGADPHDVDTRSDVYSLGVVLYELLCDRPPYDLSGAPVFEATRVIREQPPIRPSGVIRALRGDLETIVLKPLAKDRARRYQSAAELADDLRRYLTQQPILARTPSVLYQFRKFACRNRIAVIGCVGILFALLLGGIGTAIGFVRATAEAKEARLQAETASAVAQFLNEDLLQSVSPSSARQTGRGRDVMMRDVLDEASRRIDEAGQAGGRFADKPLVEAAVRDTLTVTYQRLGDYVASARHALRAVELRRCELGEEHPFTIQSLSNLGTAYWSQGHFDDAAPLLERVHETRKRLLGEEHALTLAALWNLAILRERQGLYAESEALNVRALDAMRRTLGNEHADTLDVAHNLVGVYAHVGRYAEAESLCEETLALARRTRGDDDPLVLSLLNGLAVIYKFQGHIADAESLYLSVIDVQSRVLGETHPQTLSTIGNLAALYQDHGRSADAEPLMLRILEIQKQSLGEESPDALLTMSNLTNVLRSQHRLQEAEELARKALEIQTRLRPEEHPDALRATRNLADVYQDQGRSGEAELLRLKMLPICRRALGQRHPETIGTIEELAHLYLHQDRHADALPFQRELLNWNVEQAQQADANADALNTAAWDLLTIEPAELRDPAVALPFAIRACELTEFRNPGVLDTLALAHHLSGDHAAAVETERRALALLPPEDSPLRRELESNVARFEAAVHQPPIDSGESPELPRGD